MLSRWVIQQSVFGVWGVELSDQTGLYSLVSLQKSNTPPALKDNRYFILCYGPPENPALSAATHTKQQWRKHIFLLHECKFIPVSFPIRTFNLLQILTAYFTLNCKQIMTFLQRQTCMYCSSEIQQLRLISISFHITNHQGSKQEYQYS